MRDHLIGDVVRAKRIWASAVVLAVLAAFSVGAGQQAWAAPGAPPKSLGTVLVDLDPSFVSQLFKAGVFMYGSSEVSVRMGDSEDLVAGFPLEEPSTAKATSSITIDPEVGGLSLFNGPLQATAGLSLYSIRRTGATGVVKGSLVGPFSMESGQFDKSLSVFAITKAVVKKSAGGWSMRGSLTLTPDAASTLNTLLKTTVFTSALPIGDLAAEVTSG